MAVIAVPEIINFNNSKTNAYEKIHESASRSIGRAFNEMILVLGGDASILAVNNGLGKCDGINNAGGTCSGEANNGDGRCDNGKVNNGNGLCGVLPPPPNPGIDKPVITG